jgi:hypothetical protein
MFRHYDSTSFALSPICTGNLPGHLMQIGSLSLAFSGAPQKQKSFLISTKSCSTRIPNTPTTLFRILPGWLLSKQDKNKCMHGTHPRKVSVAQRQLPGQILSAVFYITSWHTAFTLQVATQELANCIHNRHKQKPGRSVCRASVRLACPWKITCHPGQP